VEVKIVDLFSGAGGLTFGFYYSLKDGKFIKNENCEIVFANEKDPSAAKAFSLNFPDIKMLNYDIKALKENTVNALIGSEDIDLIVGGPPCQSFTTIGKRKYDDRARLYQEYIRMLKIIRPRMFIFENVKGILSMKDGANHSVMDRIVTKFKKINNDLGYHVVHRTLNAVEYGVPQYRERVFMVGIRKDQNISWTFPVGDKEKLTIKEAIDDIPPLKQGETKTDYIIAARNNYQILMRGSNKLLTFHRAALHSEKIQTVIDNISEGEGRFDFNQLVDQGLVHEKYRLTSGYKNTYARLVSTQPCTTITHNMSTPSSLRCIHYSQNRSLTPREGARLQSCPDWFQFYGTITNVKTQIGNAVPPLLAIALQESAQKALMGRQ
jgi:DNA (cytosine-5)-methyltransferase 1